MPCTFGLSLLCFCAGIHRSMPGRQESAGVVYDGDADSPFLHAGQTTKANIKGVWASPTLSLSLAPMLPGPWRPKEGFECSLTKQLFILYNTVILCNIICYYIIYSGLRVGDYVCTIQRETESEMARKVDGEIPLESLFCTLCTLGNSMPSLHKGPFRTRRRWNWTTSL